MIVTSATANVSDEATVIVPVSYEMWPDAQATPHATFGTVDPRPCTSAPRDRSAWLQRQQSRRDRTAGA